MGGFAFICLSVKEHSAKTITNHVRYILVEALLNSVCVCVL